MCVCRRCPEAHFSLLFLKQTLRIGGCCGPQLCSRSTTALTQPASAAARCERLLPSRLVPCCGNQPHCSCHDKQPPRALSPAAFGSLPPTADASRRGRGSGAKIFFFSDDAAHPSPRLEREQPRQCSLGRALTAQICACWFRTAELLPYSSSSSSSSLLPLFPVTPSSPVELSLALPFDRRVGVGGLSVLCAERLGNGGVGENGLRAAVMCNSRRCFFPQGKKESCSGFSAAQLGTRERYLHWNMQPSRAQPHAPISNPSGGLRSHWAACYDYQAISSRDILRKEQL